MKTASHTASPRGSEELSQVLRETRARTLALVAPVAAADLERVVDPLLSPLLWDLGHIGQFEAHWLLGDADEVRATTYDPFQNPRAKRGELGYLRRDDCLEFLDQVRARVTCSIEALPPGRVEMVIQHEQQHNETMLQLLRMLDDYEPPFPRAVEVGSGENDRPQEWVTIPAGSARVGSQSSGFVFDNELVAHPVKFDQFQIEQHPVTNGRYREWIEAGGYERREWWSDAGWEWLQSQGNGGNSSVMTPLGWVVDEDGNRFEQRPGGFVPLPDDAPVVHVCWYEAEAFAQAHGARLPTEFEWEVAACWDFDAEQSVEFAWDEQPWDADLANLDQRAYGTVAAPGTAVSPSGCVDMFGQVWEWTASEFSPYPGFKTGAYAEYSKPFFGGGYTVLRGGSWATRPRTVSGTFRNWDLPQRRQIFSGFRCAR